MASSLRGKPIRRDAMGEPTMIGLAALTTGNARLLETIKNSLAGASAYFR
jgi:hypothetical protein